MGGSGAEGWQGEAEGEALARIERICEISSGILQDERLSMRYRADEVESSTHLYGLVTTTSMPASSAIWRWPDLAFPVNPMMGWCPRR